MRKYIEEYKSKVESLLESGYTSQDIEELKLKIAYFQHERLIHLLVTLAFAFFAIIFLCLGMLSYIFLIPFIFFIIFLICYIIHYFFLENNVQYFYKIYDKMINNSKRNNQE